MSRPPPPDQAHRDAAIAARGKNLLVDAGAGTGKTTLLVGRLVGMVAPQDDSAASLPLSRIAAVTFTRKAAGELRLRVRERLLAALAAGPSPVKRDRLAQALADADTAFLGTIHGFADRLLRRYPVEARLSPSYKVVEEAGPLVQETFDLLLHAAEAERLAEELAGTSCDPVRAEEAQSYLLAALAAELRVENQELEWMTKHGLHALVEEFILHRDAAPPEVRPAPFQLAKLQEAMTEFRKLAASSSGDGRGSRWMAATVRRLEELEEEKDPVALFRELGELVRWTPSFTDLQMKKDFPSDRAGWTAWKSWNGKVKDETGYEERLMAPLHRWLATRLVRTFPAVVALYEKVKARHRAVDQVDLLLKLRDLLRDHPGVRGELQAAFDHVFVDEFQDTDPLQAEILLYLCERAPAANRWQDVELAAGKLTLVGDPKQSIYRFRRADIGVYQTVRDIVAKGPHLTVPLTTNFRSEPALIGHLNERFDEILGAAVAGAPDFDAVTGTAVNRRLDAGREGKVQACVTLLPFSTADSKAENDRDHEATVTATWLRSVVDEGRVEVEDPATGDRRPVRYGDVAVLAHSTVKVGLLIDELDRLGVPWSARGGRLFLNDPLHRQFLLALRAIADRDDGVAQAALLRSPFFAVDVADLVRAEAAEEADRADEGIGRARTAKELVADLRRSRLNRPPGETARDLLERSGLGRAVAFGPNGKQRLDRLRELCFELERIAAADSLDYDGVTAMLREWALEPVGLDPPRPVGGDAVQIMTIHQAKGLEFPVVVWWDGRARLSRNNKNPPWFVERTGSAWAIHIDGLDWEEPQESEVLARERTFHDAERRRLVYVASTRARDVLVLPVPGVPKSGSVIGALIGDAASATLVIEPAWPAGDPPDWAMEVKVPTERKARVARKLASEVVERWTSASVEAGRPRSVPIGVAAEAHRVVEAVAEDEAGGQQKERESRFGSVFGETVHEAVGALLREPALSAAAAVAQVARNTGLVEHLGEAAADVERAIQALEREGLRRGPGADMRLEYPVAAPGPGGTLLLGYIDLLAIRGEEVVVLDFKTDAPPHGELTKTYPAYVEQVRAYGRILMELGAAKAGSVRCGLLFTGDGGLRWV